MPDLPIPSDRKGVLLESINIIHSGFVKNLDGVKIDMAA
jgi:hypothetical protein